MPFPWLDRTPPRPDGAERRARVARDELASRAGLLHRLGFTQEAAAQRLCERAAWELEGTTRPASLTDEAIRTLVADTYAKHAGTRA